MGIAQLVGKSKKVRFVINNNDVIVIDATLKEDHSRKSPASKFPVEGGQNVSDNIMVEPFQLTITGIITDTPIGTQNQLITEVASTLTSRLLPPAGILAASAGYALFKTIAESKSPSVAAYGKLLLLQSGDQSANPPTYPQPVDVFTTLYHYPSMWIESISVPREASSGNHIEFTISLTQLLIVQPKSVNVAIFANAGLSSNQADEGEKNTGPSAFSEGRIDGHKLVGSNQ